MICTWPGCTGVHDNNRYAELCPRSRRLKEIKDQRYQSQSAVYLRRYLLSLDRRRGAQIDALAMMGPDVEGFAADQAKIMNDPVRLQNAERFRSRPKRERPKEPTICTRPISVAQVLADTANPARTLGVL